MGKLVDAVVRGPQPYFGADGVLYSPGQIVRGVPAEDVSDEPNRSIKVEVEARNGDLRERDALKFNVFAPLDSASIAGPVGTDEIATGNPDMLNVNDFLKQSDDAIVLAIAQGNVDDHLGVIEQGVIGGKKPRSAVKEAIIARLAAKNPVR